MAGTPDRSGEEQKASGGPARDEQDPRLAVARETPSAPGVDQATAVFSVRDVANAEAGSGSGSGSDTGAASAGEPGDERLRAAVAAWVGTAAPKNGSADDANAKAAAGDREEAGPGVAAEAEKAGPEPSAAASDAGPASSPGDAAVAGPAASTAATDMDEAEPVADAAESGDAGDAGPSASAGADDAEPVADAAKSGDAGDAESAAGTAEKAQPEPEAPSGVGPKATASAAATKPEATDATPEVTGAAPEVTDAAPEVTDAAPEATDAAPEATDATPKAPDAAPAAEPAEPAAKPAKPAAEPAKPAAEPVEDARPEDARPEPVDAAAAAPESTPVGDSAAKPVAGDVADAADAEDAKRGPEKPAAAAEGAQPKLVAGAEPTPAAGKDVEDTKPETGSDRGASAQGIDQATAVFKAVAPPVDQPTTMLKAPGAKAAGKEAEAGRPSKFVPLKPLDDKGKAAAPAPAPGTAKRTAGPAERTAVPEPTTQQPLPPKPPLDLLAELTNTPPPPETRVRTTVRRVKIWTPLVLLLIVIFAVVQVVRPLPTPTLDLTAKESVSFEGDKPSVPWPGQGQAAMDVNGIGTFGTSGTQKPVPIASIAKVMTVYLILRDHPLKTGEKGPKIPVDAAAQKHYETGKAEQESVVKVTEGQQLSEYEALQAVMLPSANNVAKLLARWDTKSSSEDQFVDKMNKMAKDLGMKNTTYTDPSGLDKTTVSTADDLVKLGRAAMENPVFKEISRQPSYVDLNGEKQKNFFGLVPTVAIGIKTGTTTAAGGNILFAAEKKIGGETKTIIGAALGQYGQNGTANIDEVTGAVRKLIESGQDALTAKTIVKKGDVVGEVDDGLGGTTPVVATKDVSAVGWSGLTVHLKLDGKKGETLPHTAKAGTVVGVLSVGDGKNDATAVEVPVALQEDLAEPGFGAKISRIG
ncbi:D-alanyl-D-alanine carboxypeptidase [Streptomyces sp. NPDC016845]|uniref:D-alanyl-D-alanine carboxypeptidase n=1 Tax=Streptomyces sp. NPDC016845 TaxID=3364972 RepID=UPI0037B5BF4D